MKKEQECCPKFNSKKWEGKTFNWKNKPFLKETISTLFHIPFPPMIGIKITKMWKIANEAKKVSKKKDEVLILFRDPSAFKSEICLSVTGKIPNAKNTAISGKFVSKVFNGNYNDIPKFIKQMDEYLQKESKVAKDYYVHYAYCPKSAKKYGNNAILLLAKV